MDFTCDVAEFIGRTAWVVFLWSEVALQGPWRVISKVVWWANTHRLVLVPVVGGAFCGFVAYVGADGLTRPPEE